MLNLSTFSTRHCVFGAIALAALFLILYEIFKLESFGFHLNRVFNGQSSLLTGRHGTTSQQQQRRQLAKWRAFAKITKTTSQPQSAAQFSVQLRGDKLKCVTRNSQCNKYQMLYDTWELMSAPPTYECNLIRKMGNGDIVGQGPYRLCFDRPYRLIPGRCLVYSFGIAFDWSFDDEISKFGCEVFSFDPSIGFLEHVRPQGEHFYPFGLSNKDEVNEKGWQMKTLPTIIKFLKHENRTIDILKIDIEGDEVKSLAQLILDGTLSTSVKTLLVEWHPGWGTSQELEQVLAVYYQLRHVAGFESFFVEPRFQDGFFFSVDSYANMRFRNT